MENRPLNDPLEAARRSRVSCTVRNKRSELIVEILLHGGSKLVATNSARSHHLRGMLIVNQCNQKMFEGRILVPAAAGLPKSIVEGLFEFASKTRHLAYYSVPAEGAHGL